jgi:hypothetical protein
MTKTWILIMDITLMRTLLDQIDDVKQLLPDQKYIDIMDTLTKVNESESLRLNNNILTELWYKLQQHTVKLLYTEGSGSYIRESPDRPHLVHPAEIHMVIKGERVESFANEDNGHYDKQTITIPTTEIDFIVDVQLLQINVDTENQLTVVISTNRHICEVCKLWNLSSYITDYILYLSKTCASVNPS